MKIRSLLMIVIPMLLAIGCGEGDIVDQTSDKGEESPLPGADKDDSFRKPTEHGALNFGVVSSAELTENEMFHVWDFELTGPAGIELVTSSSDKNLDTVMYLYRRDSAEMNWGHYTKRNDDDGDSMLSAVRGNFDAGLYRVLVKGFKKKARGHFGVKGLCEGAGCPKVGGNEDVAHLPTGGELTQTCMEQVEAIVNAPLMGGDGFSITYPDERMALDETSRLAADMYKSYWEDIGYWEDMLEYDDEGKAQLDIETTGTEDGTLVEVTLSGGDEMTITFVFDGAKNLRVLFHSEQSPSVQWFCEAGGQSLEEPEEFCLGAWLSYGPHDQDGEHEAGEGFTSVQASAADDELPAIVKQALAVYAKDTSVAADLQIEWRMIGWESADYGHGGTLTLQGTGVETFTYTFGHADFDQSWILYSTSGHGHSWVCESD